MISTLITLFHTTTESIRKMKEDEEEKQSLPRMMAVENLRLFDIAMTRNDVTNVSLLVELVFYIALTCHYMIQTHKNHCSHPSP